MVKLSNKFSLYSHSLKTWFTTLSNHYFHGVQVAKVIVHGIIEIELIEADKLRCSFGQRSFNPVKYSFAGRPLQMQYYGELVALLSSGEVARL